MHVGDDPADLPALPRGRGLGEVGLEPLDLGIVQVAEPTGLARECDDVDLKTESSPSKRRESGMTSDCKHQSASNQQKGK